MSTREHEWHSLTMVLGDVSETSHDVIGECELWYLVDDHLWSFQL